MALLSAATDEGTFSEHEFGDRMTGLVRLLQ